MDQPIVIIGTGLAGYSLARELRRLDGDVPMQMISADGGSFYSKPMLSSALSQGKEADELVINSATEMASTLDAHILTHTRVERIDPAECRLMAAGKTVHYSHLVLAVGAMPKALPLQPEAPAEILQVNSLDDYRRFRAQLDDAEHVAIIGPGLIGCEFANDLLSVGKSVSVIGPDPYPLSGLLPEAAGAGLARALREAGVDWHLNSNLAAVSGSTGNYSLTLDSGTEIKADLVLAAIGLRPRTGLAGRAGLDIGHGITTNRLLQTSNNHHYALGDCAEVEGRHLPFVAPLMHCARMLASTLAGEPKPVEYPPIPVVIKTPIHPVVVLPPPAGIQGRWETEQIAGGVKALFLDQRDLLRGFAVTGDSVEEKQRLVTEMTSMERSSPT